MITYGILLSAAIMLLIANPVSGQEGIRHARKANTYFQSGKFDEAEVEQLKAIESNSAEIRYQYNLGSTKYKQQKYEDAANIFLGITSSDLDSTGKAHAWHNLGNALLQQGKIKESIDAYKHSLRLNPGDLETKYNLSYALKLLKDQEQNQQQQEQQNQDQNQDQDQEQGQQQEQQGDKGDAQQAPSEAMSRKDAEDMLKAIGEDEEKTLEKAKKKQIPVTRRQIEKDW